MRAGTSVLGFILVGCGGPDLPAGWEEAVPLTRLLQSECGGDPYGPPSDRLELSARPGVVTVDLRETHFRCEQEVEGFRRDDAAGFDVLVQPVDMDPSTVAACDCLYDLRFETPVDRSGALSVSAFRRWDRLNEGDTTFAIGTSTVSVPSAG